MGILLQSLRRLSQQMSGWNRAMDMQSVQLPLLEKLYKRYGLRIELTSAACPEQYEIFKGDKQVAYYRLRHGAFRVDIPDCGGETIYEAEPNGDGIFDEKERLVYMTKALREVLKRLP
jgi:hypothetical protein